MALTLTTLNAAVSLTTQSVGNAVKTTFQSTSTAFRLHASITNGAGSGNPQLKTRLRYAVSTFNITTAQAMVQLQRDAETLDLIPGAMPAEVKIRSTDANDAFGTYLYTWLENPAYPVATVVTVTLAEG